ncbi:MAG: hypothetical protein HFI05_07075 [Lachnospiraceae bacterium]|jgi:hypothetical protein|nr:hypothetical protein [Lachnospiraceae bacterium]
MIQFQLTYCYVQFSTFVGQIQDSMCGKAKRMNYSLDNLAKSSCIDFVSKLSHGL